MPFTTVEKVKAACNFPDTGAPITDDQIQEFIYDSQEEIEDIYKTKFGVVEDNGTASSGSTSTLVDSTKTWLTTALTGSGTYEGYVVWIYGGTGEGQYREITGNNDTTLNVSPVFDIAPDATSNYRITKLGYTDETVDGSGTKDQYTVYQPLINLNYAESDSTVITVSTLYLYNFASRIESGSNDCEISIWSDTTPQLVNLKYIWGVYPFPRIIQRLCTNIAGIRTLTAQIAGTYDDFTAVTLPGLTASKGEPYVNIQSGLNFLMGEARGIVYGTQSQGQVTADFRTLNSYRPFTLFA